MALQRLSAEEKRKQSNLEAVWIEAVDAVQALPAPDPAAPTDDAQALDEDWMNIFVGYAEKASSERLQQAWGRILAGEIRKPGAFAPSTLRVMAEMDAEIATAFQEVVALRIQAGMIPKPDPMENEILIKLTFLEEVGLLQDVTSPLSWKIERRPGILTPVLGTEWLLYVLHSGAEPHLIIPFIRITRAGQQIAGILPWDERAAMKSLGQMLSIRADVVELRRFTNRRPDGTFDAERVEFIKASDWDRI